MEHVGPPFVFLGGKIAPALSLGKQKGKPKICFLWGEPGGFSFFQVFFFSGPNPIWWVQRKPSPHPHFSGSRKTKLWVRFSPAPSQWVPGPPPNPAGCGFGKISPSPHRFPNRKNLGIWKMLGKKISKIGVWAVKEAPRAPLNREVGGTGPKVENFYAPAPRVVKNGRGGKVFSFGPGRGISRAP